MCSGAAEASTTSLWVWNVDGAEWIVEARCWVLRNRAGSHWRSVLVFLGHSHTGVSWCGGWLGPALTKPLVWVSCSGCVVSLGLGVHLIGGVSGWLLPVF